MSINYNFKNTKIYIDGKEVPCETYEIEDLEYNNDIDDFGLHFNPDEEDVLLTFQSKINSLLYTKIIGIWDELKWYQKLWIRIISLFGR